MVSVRSKITKAVLAYFFLHDDVRMYVNELARRLNLDDGNLSRKLRELERDGILASEQDGREKYYFLNKDFSLLEEYRGIILKTVGLENTLRQALRKIGGLKEAYIFGSYATDEMDAASDIDLLVIGKHDTIEMQKKIASIQEDVDREINVINMTSSEYEKRQRTEPFVKSLAETKKIRLL